MDNNCDLCYKIVCKKCGWEPNDREIELVQKEILTECPVCGWSPKDENISPIME